MVSLLFLKKEISKFSLCCMKARYLREFIIYYLNFMLNILVLFFLIKGNGLFLCLRISKMSSLGYLIGAFHIFFYTINHLSIICFYGVLNSSNA